jgi:hypothetical protein
LQGEGFAEAEAGIGEEGEEGEVTPPAGAARFDGFEEGFQLFFGEGVLGGHERPLVPRLKYSR